MVKMLNIPRNSTISAKIILFSVAIIGSSVVLWLMITRLGMIQFGGYDCGGLVNLAWQLHANFRPYEDIITGVPPLFVFGAKLAFIIWPVEWLSLLKISAIFSILTFLVQFKILLRLGVGLFWSWLLSSATQFITMAVCGWWWYNPISSVTATLFFAASILLIREPSKSFSHFSFVSCAVLLLLSKPNVAGVSFISITIILIANHTRRLSIMLLTVSAILALLVLSLTGINPFRVVSSYVQASGWALSPNQWYRFMFGNQLEALQSYFLSLPFILVFILFLREWLQSLSWYFGLQLTTFKNKGRMNLKDQHFLILNFAVSAALTTVVSMLTNNEFKMVALPPILTVIAILTVLYWDRFFDRRFVRLISGILMASLILLIANAIRLTFERNRVLGVGPGTFYQNAPLRMLQEPSFFRGLLVGPRLIRLLHDLDIVLQFDGYKHVKDAPVFFGPRINFGFAVFGILPPPGLPIWWDTHQDNSRPETQRVVRRFKDAGFKVCIFLHRDYTNMPEDLLNYLRTDYEIQDFGEITVHYNFKSPKNNDVID